MGHKTHPIGFRLQVSEDWRSRWYAEGEEYALRVLEDKKIRDFLTKELRNAGLKEIEIERSIAALKVIVSTSRPGMVIGRGGSRVVELKEGLAKLTDAKLDLEVVEVRDPEVSAAIIANSIARQIERRMSFKRAMVRAAERAMGSGAKGIKIVCSGVLSGASSISRRVKVVKGSVPTQTLRAKIEFVRDTAFTTYGTIWIKVWVYKGEEEV
ncbi:30S ribosomal protein S3 [Candidatus Parcubacteria bacterium]|nr:30S ribosomal protein S3 [Candidatus Parcubacteria bacterium]